MGWILCIGALLFAAAVLLPMMTMPAMQIAERAAVKAPADMTDEELEKAIDDALGAVTNAEDAYWRTSGRGGREIDVAPAREQAWASYNELVSILSARHNLALCELAAKAPADMDDAELRAELDLAEVDVVAAWEEGKVAWAAGDQARLDAVIAERQAADGRYIAAHEVATARGWYKCAYANAEIAEIATGLKAAATTGPVVLIPGLETPVYVSWSHIAERHGLAPFDLLANGPNHKRDCKEGKTYVYKAAGKGKYVLGIVWNGVLVTVYEVTRDLLYYYFSVDDCPNPLNGGHDGLSTVY